LAEAIKGEATEITVRGKVVAKIVPAAGSGSLSDARHKKRWDLFVEQLKSQPVLNLPLMTRDELYD
jgi:antitoxin (DNA-binding transcriptional repressor) of toxin-antitoxin stability system